MKDLRDAIILLKISEEKFMIQSTVKIWVLYTLQRGGQAGVQFSHTLVPHQDAASMILTRKHSEV